MSRKPKYENPQAVVDSFFQSVSDAYNSPGEGERGRDGHKKLELLAEEFNISRIKARKILITTGDLFYPETRQIQKLLQSGLQMPAAAKKMGMAISTANSFMPYSKGIYKLSEVSSAADRTELYRKRKAAVKELQEKPESNNLWCCVCLFAAYPFYAVGCGKKKETVKFKYTVPVADSANERHYDNEEVEVFGDEIRIITADRERKEMRISRSTVDYTFRKALEKEIKDPEQLNVPDVNSYLFSIFGRFGLV